MESNDILAKLLANENINVVRGQVTTASFNIGTRTLVLPQWKNLEAVTEEMLILHEVGHALFTTDEYAESQKDHPRSFGHYLNVVEDARIERKMKDRYPGARKTFIAGYADLAARDFFEIAGRDLTAYNFIDRINLYFKLGAKCGVKFSKSEINFIYDIEKTDSIKDAIELTERLYAFCKQNAEEEIETSKITQNLDDEDDSDEDDLDDQLEGNYDYSDEEGEEEESESDINSGENDIEKKLQSETMQSLDSKLQDSADVDTEFNYYEPAFHQNDLDDELIVEYKTVLRELTDSISEDSFQFYSNKASQLRRDNASIINNMVKEFEMRKSASNWKRARTAKTGQIDTKKLYGYQIKDELFKQLTVIKDGKKHGMLFLLDWSGSMGDYMNETIGQLINLAMFARRINIPFQVFAFTSAYRSTYSHLDKPEYDESKNIKGLGNAYNVSLLELFSDRMNESEFNKMVTFLISRPYYYSRNYGLGGTPLNEALLYLTDYIGKFIQQRSVEKMVLITLTDGEGGRIVGERRLDVRQYNVESNKHINVRNFIKDPITGKQYTITDDSNTQTRVLLTIIKDRYNVSNIGFNLVSNRRHELFRLSYYILNKDIDLHKMQLDLRANRFVEVSNGAYDHYYVIDIKGLRVENNIDLSAVNSDMSAAKASRVFAKAIGTNKTSRVVLNQFVSEVA